MKRWTRKLLGIVLFAAMVIGLMAGTVYATTATPTISLGADGIANGSTVWFGQYNNSPISWRVLSSGSDTTLSVSGTGEALLISSSILARIQFNPNSSADNANVWSGSKAQEWCTDFLNNWADGSVEKAAIKQTSVTETNNLTVGSTSYYYHDGYSNYYYGAASLSNESFFFLSAKEADKYFSDDNDRKTSGADTWWWLRSPIAYNSIHVGVVDNLGCVNIFDVDSGTGARPAFNLNLSSVLFSSFISENSNTYKLTLKEKSDNLKISITDGQSATKSGNTVTVPYTVSGTNKSDATKVYALVTDKAYDASGAVISQYVALTENGDGVGSFTLSGVSGTWGTDYHVYIVAVNESGANNLSDAASTPVEITHAHEFTYTAGTGADANKITATCNNAGCDITSGLTMTINAPSSLTYDGSPKEATLSTGYSETAFPNETISYLKNGTAVNADEVVDAGNYTAQVTIEGVTAGVSFDIGAATLTNIEVKQTGTLTYNGSGQTATVDTSATSVNSQPVSFTYCDTQDGSYIAAVPSVTTAGDHTVYYMASALNHDIAYGSFTVTVDRKDLTITARDQSYDYDGDPHGEPDPTYDDAAVIATKIDVDGIVSPDTITSLVMTGTQTEAGVYPDEIKITGIGLGPDVTTKDNYNIKYVAGTLTIVAPKMAITVNGDSGTLVYNGKEQTYTGTVTATSADAAFDASKFSYTGSVAVTGKDVGSYTTQLNKDDCKYADNNYTADWTVGGPITLTITPKSITDAKVSLDKTQLTYNGSVQTVNVTGVTIDGLSLTGDDYEVTGNEGTNKGTYTVTVKGKGNFKDSATAEWSIVEKAMTVSPAGYTGIIDGQPHGITVTVTDPESGYVVKYGTVEGTYDLDTSPTLTDVGTLTVYFKVTAANYTDNTGSATITITEKPAAIVTTVPAARELTYTGTAQELVTAGTASGGMMQYALGADAATAPADGWSETVPVGTLPGTYYVWYKAVGDADHNDSAATCVTVEIKSGTLTVTATGYTGVYDGQAHGITVTVVPAESALIAYGTTEGMYDPTANPTLTDVGTLTVYFRVSLVGYADYTGSAVVTISKADAVVTVAPTAVNGLVATGAPQALVTAGTASGGEMQYTLGTDAATAPTAGWSAAIPTGTEAGIYYVWYKAVGDANHNDSAAGCVTVKIEVKEKISISGASIGKIPDQTYTGKKIKPELKVMLGGVELVRGVDYKVKYDNNEKIGFATARVIGINAYKGKTKKVTFRIIPKPVKDKKVSVKVVGKNLVVSWKRNGLKYDGFEILIGRDEYFKRKENRRIDIYDKQKIDFTVTNLEPGRMYFFRVRAYKRVKVGKKTKTLYSEWSDTVKKRLR